ncbi:MAG: 23S rRNA (adenine(2503)-C(2))-methyltransferase RlmN [Legionellales bacterium]|nr:23S rRNA (adenine(2503)-C(2))-methyltransferase RlmN [Legionellales bacterium]
MEKVNLLGFDRLALREYFVEKLNEKAFRGDQVFKWIHQARVDDFEQMSNLPKSLRAELAGTCYIASAPVIYDSIATDGTRKWLHKVGNSAVEVVLIPEPKRNTLCVSSQVGCMLDCKFCSTGKQGFQRNLTAAEIIGQLWHVQRTLDAEGKEARVTNVVFMGMGEPLLNVENVFSALSIMRDDLAYGLSKRRVTLSTSGLVPEIARFARECDAALAVSLHAPNDTLRDEIVPINKKYPLKKLLAACRDYVAIDPRRHVTIEYVMLDGVNDTPQHARQLTRLLAGLPSKVNLIPFNPFPYAPYKCSSDRAITEFRDMLIKSGYVTTVRKTRGQDIDAACGQLAGQVQDKTRRQLRWIERNQASVTDVSGEVGANT